MLPFCATTLSLADEISYTAFSDLGSLTKSILFQLHAEFETFAMSYLNITINSYKQFDDFTYSSCISMLCMCCFSPLNVATGHDDIK